MPLGVYRARTICLLGLLLVSACSSSPTAPTTSDSPNTAAMPQVTREPANQIIRPGQSANLRVVASGAAPLAYQWYRGVSGTTTQPIVGATAQDFTTPPLPGTTRYWVRVSNLVAVADSATATITVEEPAPEGSPPSITLQPADRTIDAGTKTLLKVRVEGASPLSYQWYRGPSGSTSRRITGATSRDYTTPDLTESIEYWARISNPFGSVDSATVTITVSAPPAGPQPDPDPDPKPQPNPGPDPDPDPDPDPVDTSLSFENQVVTLVNQNRAAGATCGGTWFPPVPPLSADANLRNAARAHSADMATNGYFSHTSPEGTTFDERIWDAGYSGGFPLGENIAAGQSSPASVVNGWMASSGHCSNIMKAGFADSGVGYAYLPGSPHGRYWTQNFGGG